MTISRTPRPHISTPLGVGRQLYEDLRAHLLDGTLPAGTAMLSTRACALERGLSRSTVCSVYDQLAAEGFIDTRPGAAARVSTGLPKAGLATGRSLKAATTAPVHDPATPSAPSLSAFAQRLSRWAPAPITPSQPIDFAYGPLAGDDFPLQIWRRAARLLEHERPERLAYDDPQGNPDLRAALARHLAVTRGVVCEPNQIVIVNGSQQALDLCARVLLDPGDIALVENPGYRMAHQVFAAAGADVRPVPVDDQGLCVEGLLRSRTRRRPRLLYITPTHQFPMGGYLPMARRHAVLDWAASHNAWVLEDDYDSEYRHAVRPEPTMQSLDLAQRVLYIGTFSKTLSPQLRLGYLVLPHALVPVFATAKRLLDRHAPSWPQRVLATLLEDRSYERHLRRLRRQQSVRRQALLQSVARHLGNRAEVQGASAGLHVVLWLNDLRRENEAALVTATAALRVGVHPIHPLWWPDTDRAPRRAGLVMGYAALTPKQIERGVALLAQAVERLSPRRVTNRPAGARPGPSPR